MSARILYEDSCDSMSSGDEVWLGDAVQSYDESATQAFEENPLEIGDTTQAFCENPLEFGELSQIFAENPLPLFYQIGSSATTRGAGTPWIADDTGPVNMEDAIILVERLRRKNIKYQAVEIRYQARIDPERLPEAVRDVPMLAVVDSVRQLFASLIRRSTEDLAPSDLIRFCIQADGLDKPISTKLMPVADITVEKLMTAVMKVLQSKDEIQLDAGFSVDVITIARPVGAGKRKLVNIPVDRLDKKSIFAIPEDSEGLCCAKAIVFALAHLDQDRTAMEAMRKRDRPALMKRARALHVAAHVPLGPCTFREVAQFEEHLNVQIVVLSSTHQQRVEYKGVDRPRRINLFLHEGHFDVVKSLKGFFDSDFYCERCEKPYDHVEYHRCADACYICLRNTCVPDQSERCQDCDRLCRSRDCFAAHKALSGNQELSICDRVYQCRQCCKVIRRRDCPRGMHRCGESKCPSCHERVVMADHRCFLKRVDPKDPSQKLIFFDFETDQSSSTHEVNFAVAQYEDGREEIFEGYSACSRFCEWLFTAKHKGYTVIAHNMKGFDGQFIMEWILKQGSTPEVIPCGSKLMMIRHPKANIRIIDSLNFLPMALAKLPSCFGISQLKKGYFPHLFNTRENQQYVGPLPEPQYYSPETMTPATHSAFMSWHQETKGELFDFQKEMREYCSDDVTILRRCCLQFREQFLEITKVDPFRYVTIASACMATYRSGHILPETIAMVPVHGYVNKTNFSPDSIRWLDFVASTQGIRIQHALNGAGERKIGGLSVDGFCAETNTVYQYQGCFFHGCSSCYEGDITHPLKQVTMATLRQQTEENFEKLRARGYQVIEMWEHTFLKQKKEDPELKSFVQAHHLKDRLNPRDAFFGGRTNAVKLYHEGDAKYVDFTSLYPWVNKYCVYPVGHPDIITEDFGDVDQYFGLIHCQVIPPRGLYFPVLPYRCQKKLMFPLCRTCVETFQQSPCTHADEERALTGTWVSEEVKLAKKKGYRIAQIYEIYHFKETSDSLFKSYINLFLKIKQESSGWPSDCVTEAQKTDYIRQYKDHEGIQLDPENIQKNPGRRQVSKLALNSFWGRWGMNLNKGQLQYVSKLEQFNKMLADSTKNIKDVYLPTPEVAAVQWDVAEEFVGQDANTNIFLAAFTTAWARLKLYGEMDKLGRSVLYHDTDSIVYVSDGIRDPPLGNFLGDFTDELDGDIITTFVSGGPKNYGYETKTGKTCCKVRGFTLNFRNSQSLNFHSIKQMVVEMKDRETPASIAITNPQKITRDAKKRKVINRAETKLYRVVYDKRVIQPDLTTLPYGF